MFVRGQYDFQSFLYLCSFFESEFSVHPFFSHSCQDVKALCVELCYQQTIILYAISSRGAQEVPHTRDDGGDW